MTEMACGAAPQAFSMGVAITRLRTVTRGAARQRNGAPSGMRRGVAFCGGQLLVDGGGLGAALRALAARPSVGVRP